jgi:prolyl oligopeptidase
MSSTDIIGGVTVENPYRWLEEDADPAVVEFQARADARTVAELKASPHRAAVEAAVRSTFDDLFTYAAPQRFGGAWFRPVLPPGRAAQVLEVSDSPAARGRVLVDPSVEAPDATIGLWQPSPDGSLILVGINKDGPLQFRVLRVADGSLVRDFGAMPGTAIFAWAPDNTGFYTHVPAMKAGADGEPRPGSEVVWQPLEGAAEPQGLDFDHPLAWPLLSPDGRWLMVLCDQTGPRPRWVKRQEGGAWVRFLPDSTSMYKGAIIGDEYWAITDDLSGWCRLVAIPLATPNDAATWRELKPADEGTKLCSITRCGDYVALSSIEGGTMRLRSLDLTGKVLGEVALPGKGGFGKIGVGFIMSILADIVAPDGDGCTFVHSTLERGPGVYRADLASRTIAEVIAPEHVLEGRSLEQYTAEGPDGPVLYWVMRKTSTPLDGAAPVIVTGYGGFNAPWIPCYSAFGAAWTELGGVWVHAHLRGGGEQDKDFWHAGRMHRKQGTFDDLYAVLEDLQGRGFAAPEKTGVWGSSNGGLLVANAVVQRPELIAAAIAEVPITDLMQIRKDPMTLGICMADYGNPDNPADAPFLHAISPCHHVREGARYPALLCDAGAHDTTCPPWHSRKFAAAVEAASASGRRTLLRVREGAGHNQMTTELAMERLVEELTFLCDELTA